MAEPTILEQAQSTASDIADSAGSALDGFYSRFISDADKTISFKNIPSGYLDADTHRINQAALGSLGEHGKVVYAQQIEALKKLRAQLGSITRTAGNGSFIDELGSDAGIERLAFTAGYNADRGNGSKVADWVGHIGTALKGDEETQWNVYKKWEDSGILNFPIIGWVLGGVAWCVDTLGTCISTLTNFSHFSTNLANSKATTAEDNIKKQLIADGVDEGIAAYLAREAFNADASKLGGKVKPSLEIPKTAPAAPASLPAQTPAQSGPLVSHTEPAPEPPAANGGSPPPAGGEPQIPAPPLAPTQPKLTGGVLLASLIPAGGFAAVVPSVIKNRATSNLITDFLDNGTAESPLRSAAVEGALKTLSPQEIGFFIARGLRASQSPTSTEYDNPVYGQLIEAIKKQPGINGDSTRARTAILNKLDEAFPGLNVKEMIDTGTSAAAYRSVADLFSSELSSVPRESVKPWLAVHGKELEVLDVTPNEVKYLTKAELKSDADHFGPYTMELAKNKMASGMDQAAAIKAAKDEIAQEADNVWFGGANGKMSTRERYSEQQLAAWAKEMPAYGQDVESAIKASSDLAAGNVLALRNNYAVSTIYYNQPLREALLHHDTSLNANQLKSLQEIDSAVKTGKQLTGMEDALNIPMRSEEDLKKLGMTTEQIAGIVVTHETSTRMHAYSLAEVEKLLEINADGETRKNPEGVRKEIARIYDEYTKANSGISGNKNEIWYISNECPMDITVPQSIQSVPEVKGSPALSMKDAPTASPMATAMAAADLSQKEAAINHDTKMERYSIQRATVQAAIAGSTRTAALAAPAAIVGVDVASGEVVPSSSPNKGGTEISPSLTA